MKKQIIEIDINQLDSEELKFLEKMFYEHKEMEKSQTVWNRYAFVTDIMTIEQQKEYVEKYC